MRRALAVAAGMAIFTASAGATEPTRGARDGVGWPDTTPLTDQNVVIPRANGTAIRVDVLGPRLFRIRHGKPDAWTESALNRYGILVASFPETPFKQSRTGDLCTLTTDEAALTVNTKDGSIALATAKGQALTKQAPLPDQAAEGYDVRFALAKGEKIYGLGDASRENVMRRGNAYEIWVRNVKSYIPIPMVLSNRGWGMLMNTTWRNTFDVGKSDPDNLICAAKQSELDYYLFLGDNYRALLETYTSLTGRPALLPIWGYAFTYVCNQSVDAFRMMDEALEFRKQDMPCDVIGLEPGWMSKNYDKTPQKKWHPQRFPIPSYAPKGPHTFIGALGRKGYKLSLWLCCDYDLGVYEEQLLAGIKPTAAASSKPAVPAGDPDDFEKDPHLNKPPKDGGPQDRGTAGQQDQRAEALEPWFEHLKKFVDQGAKAFKLDGCAQVNEHPKRNWGNGMIDEEMHNLYPVIYAKQMARGFEDHAKKRSMVYSSGGYAGVQQFVATWAGDTGGGPKPLISMLNLGFSGHSNSSCDMDAFNSKGIHFGFLQTWAQLNNWNYWRQPWLLTDDQVVTFRNYAQLRYKLLPYLYSSAAEAARTGYPVMRAMPMVYPDDAAWDDCRTQYMLGDSLLVSVFAKDVRLPPGTWTDFWSGEQMTGPATVPVKVTGERGGALLVKAGAIIPAWPLRDHVEKGWSADVGLLVYPSGSSSFTLHEDDGQSLDYRKGRFARTRISCETTDKSIRLTVGGREGSYAGMPATRDFTASVHLPSKPRTITLDGAAVTDSAWDADTGVATVQIPACGKTPRVLELEVPAK